MPAIDQQTIADEVLSYLGIVLTCFTDDFGYPPAGEFADFKFAPAALADDPIPTLYMSIEDLQSSKEVYRFNAKFWTNGTAEDGLRMSRAALDALRNSPFADPESEHPSGLFNRGDNAEEVGAQTGLRFAPHIGKMPMPQA
jgi:hypothetical protein